MRSQLKHKSRPVLMLLCALSCQGVSTMGQEPITIVDFESPESARRWRIVNDGVMGGLSQSGVRVTEGRTGLFQGTVSLENNGGFASVRTVPTDFGLAGYAGLLLRVRGDGRRYQLRLRTDERFDGVAYTETFDTVEGEWTTVMMDFGRFVPTFRGRRMRDYPALDPARIRQIGFLIGDKQEGTFSLEIETIKAYR